MQLNFYLNFVGLNVFLATFYSYIAHVSGIDLPY